MLSNPKLTPRHFYEDYLIVRKMHQDELKLLQNEASAAFAKLLDAQDRHLAEAEIKKLDNEHKRAQANLDRAEKILAASAPALNGNSQFIHSALEAKASKNPRSAEAKHTHTFTKADKEKIVAHCETLPPTLKNLAEAALSDDRFQLELAANPIFIKGDGEIYDAAVVEEQWLKREAKGIHPILHKPFERKDIIPCRTLIRAVEILLEIIDGKEITAQPVGEILASCLKPAMRKRVPAHVIALAENNYQSLENKHKRLFDIICRDPMTKEIMENPVLLPDGYVYDHSTAVAYLEYKNGECPMNPSISFTEKDITPCYFVIRVLDALVAMIDAKVAAAKPDQAINRPEPSAPPEPF